MSISDSDPRIFFAAERTMLAWLRTGLTIMALGFVVARFGMFMQLLSHQASPARFPSMEALAAVLGVIFVIIGAFSILIAVRQHWRLVSSLTENELPKSYSGAPALWLSLGIAFCGLILALYLAFSG